MRLGEVQGTYMKVMVKPSYLPKPSLLLSPNSSRQPPSL
jgi:hypothetical protein